MYAVHLRLIGKLVVDFILVIIELFSLGAFVLSQFTRLRDRRTACSWLVRACITAARKTAEINCKPPPLLTLKGSTMTTHTQIRQRGRRSRTRPYRQAARRRQTTPEASWRRRNCDDEGLRLHTHNCSTSNESSAVRSI